MSNAKCLGLIGGLGVGAAIHYYRELARAHAACGRTLDLVMAHAETERVYERVKAGDRAGLAAYLVGFIARMQAAGAAIAAIPAVTPHYSIREIAAASPLPVLDIFAPLRREIVRRQAKRLAVFGTRFVVESALFGLAGDVEMVPPRPDEIDFLHSTYTELARSGKGTEAQHRDLTALAQRLCERDKVDAIVLAGTDLSLVFDESNTKFPAIDCAALHIREILAAMGVGEEKH